ncbi:MAG: hypothetical protein U9Q71_01680 [Pseudomonadota bacterium]|nr:hypothetical protein [Pseudomonadota bacterium]
MDQKVIIDIPLPEWLAEHAATIEKRRRSDHVLDEILVDYSLVAEAICYWNGKSTERVEEFRDMVRELEQEIAEYIMHRPAPESSQVTVARELFKDNPPTNHRATDTQ